MAIKTVINNKFSKSSFKIAFLYIFLSFLWILFSDSLLKILKINYSLQTNISIIKGWFFVIVTGIMLYLMIDRSMEKLKKVNDENIRLLNEIIENDRNRTDFLINVSHEFRTPLNVILGSIQLIESYKNSSRYSDEAFDKLFKHIAVIRQNCYRLLKIVNNFIDITKIDSGYLELNLESCNIVEIVEKAVLSVAEFTESNGLSLTFDTEIEEKNIVCDINKIERIILNLISNAIKYNKRRGEILVELGEIDESILITVKDTGIGIPEDKKELIFKRFRQVNTSLTREQEGSGIGLSIVKSLVEMHKGEVWVESQLGTGSKFFIRLPSNLECSNIKEAKGEFDMSKRYLYMSSIEFSDI